MKQYKLSKLCPFHTLEVWDTATGLWRQETKQGLLLFGPQCGVFTEDKLTDDIARWIIEARPEFAQYIEKIENKKSKN